MKAAGLDTVESAAKVKRWNDRYKDFCAKKYSLKGWEGSVNTDLVGEDALKGAIVIHNHPTTPEEGFYDSFSKQDFVSAVRGKTTMEIVVSGNRR